MNSAADWYAEQEYRERCGMPHEGAAMPKQKISNGDRIRNMTDEELADILELSDCENCPYNHTNCGARKCRTGFLKWLKQEAKDDAEAKG